MNVPLQLRHSPGATPAVAAWFVPGDSAARVLEELARCGLAGMETRLFAVPRSLQDRTMAGLLVIPASTSKQDAHHVPRGIPCQVAAGRLYFPIDAALHPPVTPEEVRAVCPLPIHFFHPTLGLSGFEEEATLRSGDFIELPEERITAWNAARAGVEPLPSLQGIVLAEPPTIEDVYGGAEKEIGQTPPKDLPPMPDEPQAGSAAEAGRNLRGALARGIIALTGLFPKTAAHRTWVNDLADWAGKQLQGVSEQLDQLRNKELHRLLHLLQTDPDAGLRHAISMGNLPHRGTSPPGGKLGSRIPDFNANRLGGGPADFWHLTEDWQEILRRKYRELADRELRLGRFRRAAYIYAELLGDFLDAVNALKQGRHFREAALVYEKHLHNPLEAARCLAEAGLWSEAIERYENLRLWLEAAKLCERLQEHARAESFIRRAVQERLDEGDILGAAQLVQDHLKQTDEALALLLGAWPASRQAVTCLTQAFTLLGQLGRHPVAFEYLERLRQESGSDAVAPTLVSVLANAARDYPDREFRHQAADFGRVVIARQLGRTDLPTAEASIFLNHLGRLAPKDKLLLRDTNRHLNNLRSAEVRRRQVTPPPIPGRQPVLVRRIELPRQIEWMQLRAEWHWFFAVGVTRNHLTLVRGVWDGPYQSVSWECPVQVVRNGLFHFEAVGGGPNGSGIALGLEGQAPFSPKVFPATDAFFDQRCVACTPGWLQDAGICSVNDENVWSIHVAAGRAILTCRTGGGALQRTIDITVELLQDATRDAEARLCLVATNSGAAVALGNRLVILRGDGPIERLELPRQAAGLVRTLPHTRQGIVVLLEHGAMMHWAGASDLVELDRDLPRPQAAFLPGGPLVLLSRAHRTLLLLEVDSRGVKQVTKVVLTGQPPVSVSSTASVGQFAVLEMGGVLSVYRVQP